MSPGNAEVVRQPLRSGGRPGRTLDQRLSLRFPRLAAANALVIGRLPPRSRLRQAALARTGLLALEAYNRRDLDAAVVGAHPDFEYHPNRDWVDAGLVEARYRGLDEYRSYVATVDEVWGGENYLTPSELIDLGDRFVMLATGNMRAQASGVELTESFALVGTLRDGRATHMQEYYDHGKALESVGLPPSS